MISKDDFRKLQIPDPSGLRAHAAAAAARGNMFLTVICIQ